MGKHFEGDLLSGPLTATLLQIFIKINLNSKVLVINITDLDDNFWGLLSMNGLNLLAQSFDCSTYRFILGSSTGFIGADGQVTLLDQ